MARATAALIGALVLFQGGDAFERGRSAYEAGRFSDALALFGQALAEEGDDAPAELWFDHALAALGAGDPKTAAASAERAAARGGIAFAAEREFLLGSAAALSSERAAAQARTAEAEPFAFDIAIEHANEAFLRYREAAVLRAGWPEASRNAERMLSRIASLREQAAAAALRRQKERLAAKPRVRAVPPDAEKGNARGAEREPAPLEIAGAGDPRPEDLFDLLARKEAERRADRLRRQRAAFGRSERGW
ncbi:MAG: hypothetical protein Fur0037_15060 [Planctomycetota bacterium]